MKPSTCVWIALAFSAVAAPSAAQEFEGVVRQRTFVVPPVVLGTLAGTAGDDADVDRIFELTPDDVAALPATADPMASVLSMEQTISTAGRRSRIDIRFGGPLASFMGEVYMVNDGEADRTFLVMPAMRTYMEMDAGSIGQALAALAQVQPGATNVSAGAIREIGSREILGYDARGYELRAGDEMITRAWTAADLRDVLYQGGFELDDVTSALQARGYPLLMQALARPAEPMRATVGSGYMYVLTEVESIEREEVDEALFDVPEGYSRLEAGAMPMVPFSQ